MIFPYSACVFCLLSSRVNSERARFDLIHKGFASQDAKLSTAVGPVPRYIEGYKGKFAYEWIRKDNSEESRRKRREISETTLLVARHRVYMLGGRIFRLPDNTPMLTGTRHMRMPIATTKVSTRGTAVWEYANTVFEVAVYKKRKTVGKVVAVNAASAYHTGGGFRTGGMHALEESMCVQSDLIYSLEKARSIAGIERGEYIPAETVVFSPSVLVFRKGTNQGYEFLEEPVLVDGVISFAMPNLNPMVKDSPDQSGMANYEQHLLSQWFAVFSAAANVGADVVIVPDAGCGIFMNDPVKVGAALGKALALPALRGRFKEVVLALPHALPDGSASFTRAVEAVVGKINRLSKTLTQSDIYPASTSVSPAELFALSPTQAQLVERLAEMGFPPEQARRALHINRYNADLAIQALLKGRATAVRGIAPDGKKPTGPQTAHAGSGNPHVVEPGRVAKKRTIEAAPVRKAKKLMSMFNMRFRQ